jgi:hypothetical protein
MVDARPVPFIEFDATAVECADVQLRLVRRMATYTKSRRNAQWFVGAVAAVSVILSMNQLSGASALATLAISLPMGTAVGLVCALLYRPFHESYVRSNVERATREFLRGAETIRCRMELRPEGMWTHTPRADMSLPWPTLKEISSVPGAIEFWFDGGLVVVRDRGFATPADRESFVAAARELAGRRSSA